MKLPPVIVLGAALLVSLTVVPPAHAQLLWRWFGGKTPDKAPAAKSAVPDDRRITETSVEIAWLADPVTFPYYLEAHTTASQLEVRGYVPNKAVREHAMRIAQVYSSVPVVDSMKQHESLLVRPGKMSSQQLQASAQSSLKVAVPKAYPHLQVQAAADGKVYVAGPVNTYDEKLAVSHSLRRLHGCSSVQNLTTVPLESAAVDTEAPRERTPIVKTSNPDKKADRPIVAAEPKARPWYWPFGKSPAAPTKDEPPLLNKTNAKAMTPTVPPNPPAGPILIPDGAAPRDFGTPTPKSDVVKVELPPHAPKKQPVSAAALQKAIKSAWPGAKSVNVEFTSATEIRVILEIRDEKELNAAVERIVGLPELQNLRTDMQFKIGAP